MTTQLNIAKQYQAEYAMFQEFSVFFKKMTDLRPDRSDKLHLYYQDLKVKDQEKLEKNTEYVIDNIIIPKLGLRELSREEIILHLFAQEDSHLFVYKGENSHFSLELQRNRKKYIWKAVNHKNGKAVFATFYL
jgi:hypothetical protein